ncbi:MAG: glycosyltransferase family 2 protein [Chromatiaceae bacterium]|nr:glycosyltransferase family 2 protein [Chromatiaceae bacterium]
MQLGILVPCYNEEAVIDETARRLLEVLARLRARDLIDAESFILFIDDGSTDASWRHIEALSATHGAQVRGLKLSRNRGHQNALLAGLREAPGDALVSIDADLQDDIGVIETMVERHHEGYEVVYGVRERRDSDSAFKRLSAEGYYRLLHLLGVTIVFNHADYRLLGRRALDALAHFEEVNLFLRGVVPLLGFCATEVGYARAPRFAGVSKYPLHRMAALALDGVTSFSVAPLRLITLIGLLTFAFSMTLGLWALWVRLFTEQAVPGWASTVVPFYFLGGVQLLCIGILGEYLGKVYSEVKRRPHYVIEQRC